MSLGSVLSADLHGILSCQVWVETSWLMPKMYAAIYSSVWMVSFLLLTYFFFAANLYTDKESHQYLGPGLWGTWCCFCRHFLCDSFVCSLICCWIYEAHGGHQWRCYDQEVVDRWSSRDFIPSIQGWLVFVLNSVLKSLSIRPLFEGREGLWVSGTLIFISESSVSSVPQDKSAFAITRLPCYRCPRIHDYKRLCCLNNALLYRAHFSSWFSIFFMGKKDFPTFSPL